MSIDLSPPHEDLTFMAPLSEDRARRLVEFVASGLAGAVVDIGCGWAELLLRVVAAAPGSRGVGVDLDADSIGQGRRLAAERGLSDRVTLIEGDGKEVLPDHAEAVICIGASHVWNPPSDHVEPMGYARALDAIRAMVEPGAHVVYGEAIWSAPPTDAAIAPLGRRLDEHKSLPELVEIAVAAGFLPFAVHEANTDEWDEFESGCAFCYTRWLIDNGPDHADAREVKEMAARQRDGYLRGYRGILGLGYLQLIAV